MLNTYNEVVNQLQEKREAELKPEEKIKEKTMQQVLEVADSLSMDGVVQEVSALKSETGKLLSQMSDKLEEEVNKYRQIKRAVEVKGKELQEIYEIQKSASSLAALIEAQHQMRQEFEFDMMDRKEDLSQEMKTLRAEWEQEKKRREAEIKERDAAERKQREREKEEYLYVFQREQQLAREQFQDEKSRLERDIQNKREQMEKELAEREQVVTQKEEELNQLRERVNAFPKELESAVNKALKDAMDRVQLEAKNREELLKKEFEGKQNVLNTRIESFEKTVKEQNEQIVKLSQQAEKAAGQVQDIALKAISSSADSKTLTSLQQWVSEQARKPSA
jgi:hypothetical protein